MKSSKINFVVFLAILFLCVECFSQQTSNCSAITDSYKTSIRLEDHVFPRYVIIESSKHGHVLKENGFVLFNIETEKALFFKLPQNLPSDLLRLNVVPIENENKYGILYPDRKSGFLKYAICGQDAAQPCFFKPDDLYCTSRCVSLNDSICFVMYKQDNTCDVRSSKDFSEVTFKYEGLPPRSNAIRFSRFTENNLLVESFFWPRSIKVWDCKKKETITEFAGSSFFPNVEVDSSGEFGIFYMPVDFFDSGDNTRQLLCLQVRSLRTGDIVAQCVGRYSGVKFSPTDSRIVLLWTDEIGTAILWKYSTSAGHNGDILRRFNIPVVSRVFENDDSKPVYDKNIHATFSSDGKKIVFISDDLNVFVFSTDTGELLRSDKIKVPEVVQESVCADSLAKPSESGTVPVQQVSDVPKVEVDISKPE